MVNAEIERGVEDAVWTGCKVYVSAWVYHSVQEGTEDALIERLDPIADPATFSIRDGLYT